MSFNPSAADRFAKVLERSDYATNDHLVKVQYVPRGNNVIVGRAGASDRQSNLVYVGKVAENTAGSNLLGADVWLDVSFPHVIYITGTRGSGKSFDLGVLVEGISTLSERSAVQENVDLITSFVIDTQNQFWTLGYPPRPGIAANAAQLSELANWNIKPNAVADIALFLPPGAEPITGTETTFTLSPDQISHEEWCALIGQDVYSPQGHVLGATLDALQSDFSVDNMMAYIDSDRNWRNVVEATRQAVLYKLTDLAKTGLFQRAGFRVGDLLHAGRCNIFMLRDLRDVDKSLVTSIIARQLFTLMGQHHRQLKRDAFFGSESKPPALPARVWLIIDEAHVVAPSDRYMPAREALVEYVKRGRDAGLSLVLATQQPSAIDDRILSQVNLAFTHRLAFQSDINAAINRVPTKAPQALKLRGTEVKDFTDMIRVLDAGECFLGDQTTSRAILTRIRPRVTSHGGYSPI
jgi:uncharacterized protein